MVLLLNIVKLASAFAHLVRIKERARPDATEKEEEDPCNRLCFSIRFLLLLGDVVVVLGGTCLLSGDADLVCGTTMKDTGGVELLDPYAPLSRAMSVIVIHWVSKLLAHRVP